MTFEIRHSAGIEYFERPGTGTTLVLLHGIGSNGPAFAPLLSALPAEWRIIAWNAPGYGQSTPLPSEWPVASDYADAFGAFADRLGLGEFVLVGHSLGALMATSFSLMKPERIRRLVLTAPASGHGVIPGSELSEAARARVNDVERLGAEEFATTRAPRLVFDPQRHPNVVEGVRLAMSKVSLPGYAQAARMLSSGRLLEDVAKLSVPTDVVAGLGDLVVPPENARRVYQALSPSTRGQMHEIPETGHALYLQTPSAFAQLLKVAAG